VVNLNAGVELELYANGSCNAIYLLERDFYNFKRGDYSKYSKKNNKG
jgi:hypothetical protein